MSTGSNNTPRYVNCPKCDGAKYIRGFSHYAGGVCFMCSGNGTVEANGVSTPASAAPAAHKIADCGEFGKASVYRHGTGFQAFFSWICEDSERGGLVTFDVVAGKVVNTECSIGFMKAERPLVVAALQAALKR